MDEQLRWSIVDEMPTPRGTNQATHGIYSALYDLVLEMAKPEVQASPIVRVDWTEKGRAAKAQSSLFSWFERNLPDWQPTIRLRGNSLYIQIVHLPEGQERQASHGGNGGRVRASKYAALRAEIDTLAPGQVISKKCPGVDARKIQDYAEYWIKFQHPDWAYETHLARPKRSEQNYTLYIGRNA